MSKAERNLISENAILDQTLPYELKLGSSTFKESPYLKFGKPQIKQMLRVCNKINIKISEI